MLAPWPNRLTDGRYRYGGHDCQAPLNEPSRHGAIHGLVRWLDWSPVVHDPASVTLSCALRPQPGYEWQLDLEVTYALDDAGLTVTFQAANADASGPRSASGSIPTSPSGRTDRRASADHARHQLPRPSRSAGPPEMARSQRHPWTS